MNSKKAKFFCENCGAEVEQDARFCKKCGRFFTSVRCPCCGYVGSANAFTNGCPECGYAENGSNSIKTQGHHNKKNVSDSPLPAWIYLLTIAILLGIVLAILYLYSI